MTRHYTEDPHPRTFDQWRQWAHARLMDPDFFSAEEVADARRIDAAPAPTRPAGMTQVEAQQLEDQDRAALDRDEFGRLSDTFYQYI